MKSITHREFRNHSGQVLREVAVGEVFEVTNNGAVVARLVPAGADQDLRIVRPASKQGGFAQLTRYRSDEASGSALDDMRGDR